MILEAPYQKEVYLKFSQAKENIRVFLTRDLTGI
jgi:hypothetical protein